MRFVVITYAPLIPIDGKWYGYTPYIKEMNLWLRHVDEAVFVCPIWQQSNGMIISALEMDKGLSVMEIPEFDLLSKSAVFRSIPAVFRASLGILKGMRMADHIHLRVPGNIGLLASFWQIVFPGKKKTAKYAGNWDYKSKQPWSYRWQQRILENTTLTKNMQVLVYGHWPNSSHNILPFFTASYREADKVESHPRSMKDKPIRLIFVGEFFDGKKPLISCAVAHAMREKGYSVRLDMFGKGQQMPQAKSFVEAHNLEGVIFLHGSQPPEVVKEYFQKAHFLVFISKSEGWPKVVAESMWWGCLPITTEVSCVPEMVGQGSRGSLVPPDVDRIVACLESWINHSDGYDKACSEAMQWARQYTLERFETEIKQLI